MYHYLHFSLTIDIGDLMQSIIMNNLGIDGVVTAVKELDASMFVDKFKQLLYF